MNKTYANACLRWLVNELYPYYMSKELPKTFVDKMDKFYDIISKDFDWVNPKKEELNALGFLNWEEHDENSVWFIPQWLYPAIPDCTILYDQHENMFEFNRVTTSSEGMFGCLRYGVLLNQENVNERNTSEEY